LPLVSRNDPRAHDSQEVHMGIAVSLILVAVGAILTWAVNDTSDAVNLAAVGVILMVVGLIGLLLDLLLWSSWGPGLRRRAVPAGPPAEYDARPTRRVEEPVRPRRRRVVEEEEVVGSDVPPGPPPP
jgi:hypothetical protein